ncbi:MAG: OmpA family protein [Deltaproteobacteria bacterium]|nr:OmpA family protein [Deltaproteobacteria bacterium]
MKRFGKWSGIVAVLVLGVMAAGEARADNPKVNSYFFRPSPHPGDLMNIVTTNMPKQWGWGAGAWITYNRKPLWIEDIRLGSNDSYWAVKNQTVMDIFASVAFLDWLNVGFNLPMFLNTNGDAPKGIFDTNYNMNRVNGFAVGDLRLSAKARFFKIPFLGGQENGFGMGLVQDVSFPTATGRNFTGDDGVTGTTTLITDFTMRGWQIALNMGVRLKKTVAIVDFPPVTIPGVGQFSPHKSGHQLLLGAGIVAPILCNMLEIIGTLESRTSLVSPYNNKRDNALDLMGGVRLHMGNLRFIAAAGGGVLSGYGSPSVRATVNLAYEPDLEKGCCRDPDGDGICEPNDLCPQEAGPENTGGCPDRDGDGVADLVDACPDEPGPAELNGCPDTDGDGIIDSKDACPQRPGPKKYDGCPDTDGDGIPDPKDKCPEVPGVPELDGCPRVVVTEKKIEIHQKVFFETNKAVIKPESFGLLKDVAKVIKDNPQLTKIRVDGHTDNVNTDAYNLRLSRRRAKAVRDFLVKQGVSRKRLSIKGFGESKPIADNATEEGKAKNRRVEFVIIGKAKPSDKKDPVKK